MTSKGQITLPAAFREKLSLVPGKKLTIELDGDKIIVNAPIDADALRRDIRDFMNTHHPAPVTQAEIDAIKTVELGKKYFGATK